MPGASANPRRLLAHFVMVSLASVLCLGPMTATAHAVPPATAAAASLGERWIEHRVAPGERIAEIGDYYGVSGGDIIRWNKLDEDRPMIRTGQLLRIQTDAPSQSRVRDSYTVRRGDSWATLAKRFAVTIARMRDHWNKGEETLRLGARIVVFRIPEPEPQVPPAAEPMANVPNPAPAAAIFKPPVVVAPVVPPMIGAHSTGAADRGRILNATQIPANPALYTIRKPEHSYGSSHAIKHLTLAIQRFRTTGFDREIVIQDMSRKGGGRFRPHESHQSGRDVDIRLPLKQGIALGTIPESLSLVDWDATWALMRELIATNEVRFIFLSRNRQKPLYEAALRTGANKDELATLLQFPRRSRTAVIRHARGHVKHFHVRFKCSPEERSCLDPGF